MHVLNNERELVAENVKYNSIPLTSFIWETLIVLSILLQNNQWGQIRNQPSIAMV